MFNKIPRQISVAVLASMLILPAASADQIGLQLYSLREQMAEDLPAALATARDWGLDIVEGGGNLYGLTADEYRNALEQNGLALVSVDTSLEELRDNPIAAVYKARFYSAELVTFYWIGHDDKEGFTIEHALEAVEIMNTAGKLLAEHGLTLQYHLHGYEFLPHGDGTVFDAMVAGTTDAQFQLDVFWVRQAGVDPTKLLQKYPGRFTSLHLKDRAPGTPDSSDGRAADETNVVLGTGDVGIAAVMAEARKQGVEYFFLEDESPHVLKQVPESLAFLETLPNQ